MKTAAHSLISRLCRIPGRRGLVRRAGGTLRWPARWQRSGSPITNAQAAGDHRTS